MLCCFFIFFCPSSVWFLFLFFFGFGFLSKALLSQTRMHVVLLDSHGLNKQRSQNQLTDTSHASELHIFLPDEPLCFFSASIHPECASTHPLQIPTPQLSRSNAESVGREASSCDISKKDLDSEFFPGGLWLGKCCVWRADNSCHVCPPHELWNSQLRQAFEIIKTGTNQTTRDHLILTSHWAFDDRISSDSPDLKRRKDHCGAVVSARQ